MRSLELGIAADQRIPPTPEDLEICRHNIRRVMRWMAEANPLAPGESRTFPPGYDALAPIRNCCGDYLHFKPTR